jgi:3-phenylpropionate/trans-cinnamate dioxygenase ferredoxin reductase component
MGRAAGWAMAGASDPYHHLPFFYSDLFDLGYEAVGELHPILELIADWQEEPYRKAWFITCARAGCAVCCSGTYGNR